MAPDASGPAQDRPRIDVVATVILPAIDETDALRETVTVVGACARVGDVLFVLGPRTTAETRAICEAYVAAAPDRYRIHDQRLPGLGGAVREAFTLARGSHVVLMASDLETDPRLLPALLDAAVCAPDAVVTASRWRPGGALHGYGRARTMANGAFQRVFAALYGVALQDLTYGYRVFPTPLVQRLRWEELGHALLFETLVKPLRAGVEVVEVPAVWRPRSQGRSSAHALAPLAYLRIGLRVRLRAPTAVFA